MNWLSLTENIKQLICEMQMQKLICEMQMQMNCTLTLLSLTTVNLTYSIHFTTGKSPALTALANIGEIL